MTEQFQALIGRLLAHTPDGTRRQPMLASPPTAAEWERLHIVHHGVTIPEAVYALYGIANGFESGSIDPVGMRWEPLPIEPAPWVSFAAPCRPEAQLPVAMFETHVFMVLCEGPQAGEVWHAEPRRERPDTRVARSLVEFFEHLALLHEAGEPADDVVLSGERWEQTHPAISRCLAGGADTRPLDEQARDGGWPVMYEPDRWDYIQRGVEADAAWFGWRRQWRETHFPDLEPVRRTPRDVTGTFYIPAPEGSRERRPLPGVPPGDTLR